MNLRDFSLQHKSKREITDLDKIPVSVDVQTGKFKNQQNQEVEFNFVEIDGYKYTIKAKQLDSLKRILNVRPSTQHVQFQKTENGEIICIPLD